MYPCYHVLLPGPTRRQAFRRGISVHGLQTGLFGGRVFAITPPELGRDERAELPGLGLDGGQEDRVGEGDEGVEERLGRVSRE